MITSRWRHASFRTQIVFSTMALIALGMVAVTFGIQLLLHQTTDNTINTLLEERNDAVVAAVDSASGTTLTVPAEVLEPGVAVYDARGRRVAGDLATVPTEHLLPLTTVTTTTYTRIGERARLRAQPFTTGSGVSGVVIVSEPLAPYERAGRFVLFACIAIGLIVLIASGLIARWVTNRALAPVVQMADRATDWSEHDLGRRFELGPSTNEIAALGNTLDGLLERVAMTIRAEQRLTSELAHELRTPLAAIQGSADLALMRGEVSDDVREDLEQIALASRAMAVTITTLLDLAREPEAAQSTATCLLGDVVDAVVPLVPDKLALARTAGPDGVRVAAPRDLVVRALSPVVENAVRHARSAVSLDVAVHPAGVEVRVGDDGPGVDPTVREAVFDAGATGPGGGTGLGLGIARRVARSVGGDVLLAEGASPAGGALFVLRLPRL
ncbi:HAMP domain-containing sensor histidine kinase [Nocardioides sp. LS1]|uniref:sensor histidine kinase n=1 Tax=Nocardioides sp. LS1 TaxID=1027620 RepID=UPI000F61BA1A|nr:HAMP domain-containing sensor histidine kinase [Nocardioides sp. LS1]GCD88546.1 two-component sensor histidine kinase [Nocardioides sp. LS1]